ncbi:MAG: sigma 54-interacting transcriptional regulator [Bacteroidota bacterium]
MKVNATKNIISSASADSAVAKIFIVDDEFIIAENMRHVVQKVGFDVCGVAKSTEETLKKLEKVKPDLLLLDINLGRGGNGIDLSYEIRKRWDIPFVFISSYANPDIIHQAKQAKPYGYIVKPFTEKDIKVVIELALYKAEVDSISRQEKEKRLLLEISHAIAGVRVRADLETIICQQIKAIFPFDEATILQRNTADAYEVILDLCTDTNTNKIRDNRHLPTLAENDALLPATNNPAGLKEVNLAQLHREMPDHPLVKNWWNRGCNHSLMAPLIAGQKLVGYFIINTKGPRKFDRSIHTLFLGVADLLALGVRNIIATEALIEKERMKSLRLRLIDRVASTKNWLDKMPDLVQVFQSLCPADFTFFGNYKPTSPLLSYGYYRTGAREFQAYAQADLLETLKLSPESWATEMLKMDYAESVIEHPGHRSNNPFIATLAKHFRMEEWCIVPVALRHNSQFFIAFFSRQSNYFTTEILENYTSLVHSLGPHLDNQLAYAEIARLTKQLKQEKNYLQEEVSVNYKAGFIVGNSPLMLETLRQVQQVAATHSTVLITGESGTGKELIARAIHENSKQADRPLVKVNCAALPANLIESELFGHEKGAFTGAISRRIGKFELAHNGTIFLDEIGEIPIDLQPKLLRVLQEQEFERLGGNKSLKTQVRIIAATNRNLEEEVKAGRFRMDLYYRLHVFPIRLPSLRERKEDIPLLADFFLKKYAKKVGRPIRGIAAKSLQFLHQYSFPGNVRELEHLVERAVITCQGNLLQIAPIAETSDEASATADTYQPETLANLERNHVLATLKFTKGRIRGDLGAAKLLDIKPTTLEARMKKLGIKKGFY